MRIAMLRQPEKSCQVVDCAANQAPNLEIMERPHYSERVIKVKVGKIR